MSKRSSEHSDICHICHHKNPPQRERKVLPKRAAKGNSSKELTHINWICCDVCKSWSHSDCCGLTQKDYRKLTSGEQYFKCIGCCISDSCCIKDIQYHPAADQPDKHEVQPCSIPPRTCGIRAKDNIEVNEVKVNTTAISISNSCCIKDVKHQSDQLDKYEVQPVDIPQCTSGTKAKHNVEGKEVEVNITPIDIQQTTQVRDTSLSAEGIDLESQQERQNIIIVDCISNPTKFTRSDNILREVQSFAPLIQVKYAYSLAKGGVAIHLNNIQDKLTLLQSFTTEAFGGAKISDLAERNYTVSLKNVPTYVSLDTVRLALQDKSIEAKQLLRQQHKLTGRPQPVIKVVCSNSDARKLTNNTIISVGSHICDVVRNNAHVLRCYNCQQFGHIARACTNTRRCINCSDVYCNNGYCRKPSKCFNCGGPHRASDRSCPIYQRRHALLAGQHPQPKYIKKSAGTDNFNSSNRDHAAAGNLVGEGKFQHEGFSTTSD